MGLAADLFGCGAAVALLLSGHERAGAGWMAFAAMLLLRAALQWGPLLVLAAAVTDYDGLTQDLLGSSSARSVRRGAWGHDTPAQA